MPPVWDVAGDSSKQLQRRDIDNKNNSTLIGLMLQRERASAENARFYANMQDKQRDREMRRGVAEKEMEFRESGRGFQTSEREAGQKFRSGEGKAIREADVAKTEQGQSFKRDLMSTQFGQQKELAEIRSQADIAKETRTEKRNAKSYLTQQGYDNTPEAVNAFINQGTTTTERVDFDLDPNKDGTSDIGEIRSVMSDLQSRALNESNEGKRRNIQRTVTSLEKMMKTRVETTKQLALAMEDPREGLKALEKSGATRQEMKALKARVDIGTMASSKAVSDDFKDSSYDDKIIEYIRGNQGAFGGDLAWQSADVFVDGIDEVAQSMAGQSKIVESWQLETPQFKSMLLAKTKASAKKINDSEYAEGIYDTISLAGASLFESGRKRKKASQDDLAKLLYKRTLQAYQDKLGYRR